MSAASRLPLPHTQLAARRSCYVDGDEAEVGVVADSTEFGQFPTFVEFQHKCVQDVRGHPKALNVGCTSLGMLRVLGDACGVPFTLEASLALAFVVPGATIPAKAL
jgi:hypothetical protein